MTEKRNANNFNYLSARGIPLLYVRAPGDKPVLTLENYTKWYGMDLVMPSGLVEGVDPEIMSAAADEEKYCVMGDHLFHPRLLIRVAKKLDAYLDERAVEVAAGRWMLESSMVEDIVEEFKDKLDFHGSDLE